MADTIPISQLAQLTVSQITASAIFPISNISDNTTFKVLVGDLDAYFKTSTGSVQNFGGTSKYAITASYATSSATASFLKFPNVSSASYAVKAISSSYANSSSFSTNAISAGYASVANVVLNPFTATLVPSSSATLFLQYNPANPNNGTASYSILSQNSVTSSYVNGANIFASSSGFANSASWSPIQLPNITNSGSYTGILQNNPKYALDISGSIGNSSTGNGINLTLDNGSNTILQSNAAQGSWHFDGTGIFYFISSGSGIVQYRFGGLGNNSYVGGSGNGDFFGVNTELPQHTLDVNGDINFSGNLSKSGNPFTASSAISSSYLDGNIVNNRFAHTNAIAVDDGTGNMILNTNGATIKITRTGMVGINNTNPQQVLDVNGFIGNSVGNVNIISANGALSGSNSGSSITLSTGFGYNGSFYNGSSIAVQGGNGLSSGSGANIILKTGQRSDFSVGSVGINTNSPSASLDVVGSINFTTNLNKNGVAYVPPTSSYSLNALTASYISGVVVSSSYANTATNLRYNNLGSTVATSGNGLMLNDTIGSSMGLIGGGIDIIEGSGSTTVPFTLNNPSNQPIAIIDRSGNYTTTGYVSASNFYGTASNAVNALTASYVSGSNNSNSSSYALFALNSLTASYSLSSSNLYVVSSSYATSSLTASYALTASYVSGSNNSNSSSYANFSLSSSFLPNGYNASTFTGILTNNVSNFDLASWYNVPFKPSNTQSVFIANTNGAPGFQATIVIGNFWYGGTTFEPSSSNSVIARVNMDSMTYQTASLTGSVGYTIGEFTYNSSSNQLFASTVGGNVFLINPTTLSSSLVIYNGQSGSFGRASSLTNDGTYLYVINNADNNVFKYQMSNYALVASASIAGFGRIANIKYDGQYLWIPSQDINGAIARMNPTTLSYISASVVGADFITDDMAITPSHVYLGCEGSVTNQVYVINKTNLSYTSFFVDNMYAMWYDNEYVWMGSSITSSLYRLDPTTMLMATFNCGVNLPNEIVGDGKRLMLTSWLSNPWQVTRYVPESPIYMTQLDYAANFESIFGISFYTGEDLTTGIFSTNQINIWSGKISNEVGGFSIDTTNGGVVIGKAITASAINSLDVYGNISCSAITASLFTGTSSYANTAQTSSFMRLFNPTTNSWYAIQISGSVGQETLLFTPTT
jgi:hypothetical protein